MAVCGVVPVAAIVAEPVFPHTGTTAATGTTVETLPALAPVHYSYAHISTHWYYCISHQVLAFVVWLCYNCCCIEINAGKKKCAVLEVHPFSKKTGYLREQTLLSILVTSTSSTFKLAGILGSSTRELASNTYPGTRCFTPGNPGDGECLSPKPPPLRSTSYKYCRKPV